MPKNLKAPVEVPTPAGPPEPPKGLGEVAAMEWRRAATELHGWGVLTAGALATLEVYCQTFAEIRELGEILEAKGLTFETVKGYVGQRPEVAIRNTARAALKAYATALGLTPAARSKLGWKAKGQSPAERMAAMRAKLGKTG